MSWSYLSINGWEFVLLAVIAVIVLGPERLPEYVAKLRGLIRQARAMADSARGQLREQMGPEFDDIDWRRIQTPVHTVRQIVREALLDDGTSEQGDVKGQSATTSHDPSRPTPFDTDAT